MSASHNQDLISTITKQADQIKRYENRLRDVIAAYKGIVKEKEALEESLKALNHNEAKSTTENDDSVSTLASSLSKLAEEKSRMELAFQEDKKVTREKYEIFIKSLKDETKLLVQQHQAEVNNLRAKIAYEMQEREKEAANQSAMIREMQIKFDYEFKSKDKLGEKQSTSTETQSSNAQLEKRVRDLSSELEAAQRRMVRAENRSSETPALLVRLQEKMALLEQTHAVAIREEQIKAKRAEESARKMCAKQEERVAILEERLAELSQTVGEYDARKRQDQLLIKQLKDKVNTQLIGDFAAKTDYASTQKSETDTEKLADSEYLQTLIDKIHLLKKELISENEKLGSPIDIPTVLKLEGYENLHTKCRDDIESLKEELDMAKAKNSTKDGECDNVKVVELNDELVKLKVKLEDYKVLLEEEKCDKDELVKMHEEKLKSEHSYYSEIISDLKSRVQSLEKQVQTHRDRYVALLEETDNYVKSRNERIRKISADELRGNAMDASAPPHMLHYAHELARKDLDISQLRKDKHMIEGQLRDSQRDSTIEKDRFKEVLRTLREEIERLRRIQSREGANLEYLKNVVISYLMSTDYVGKRHMLNAIAAVLHFTKTEKNMILKTI